MGIGLRLFALVVAVLGTTGCDHKQDALRRATDCLRDHHARVIPQPPWLVKAAARQGWPFRSFQIDDNVLTVGLSPTDAAAAESYRRAVKAKVALDASLTRHHPAPVRRGRIVYWWVQPPSRSQRAVFRRCVGG